MDFQEKKIFKNLNNNNLEQINIPKDVEYYNFIETNDNKGLKQIIITSDLMLKIIKEYFLDNKATILDFELMQEDYEFYSKCKVIIEKMNEDRGYFQEFLEEVKYLYSKECIDIKKCRFKYRNTNMLVDITIYINGNISISRNDITEHEMNILLERLSKFISG